jgi:protein TonB
MASPTNHGRLPLVIGLSVGIHLLIGLGLMQLPQSREIIRKIVPVTLVEREKPKPPAPPKPRPAPPRPTDASKPKPAPKQALRPAQPLPPSQPANGAAQSFGVSEGPGGTMEVPLGETLEAEATASAPLRLSFEDGAEQALEREPEPIGRLRVSYPEIARLAGATGSVLVEAYVGADGRVSRVEVLQASGGAAFIQAAKDALRLTRFRPGLRGGEPVACTVVMPVTFTLSEVPDAAR